MLTWGGDALATEAHVATSIATKQDQLQFQSETAAAGNIDLSTETAATPVYINWPSGATNSTGYQSLGVVYKGYMNLTVGSTIFLTLEMRGGTTSSTWISVNDSNSWTGVQYLLVSGLSTSSFRKVSWSWTVPANGTQNLHVNVNFPGVTAQPAGTVHIRNMKVSTTADLTTVSSKLACSLDIACASNISCVALTQTSDERIKSDYKDVSEDLLKIFDGAEIYSYVRDDQPNRRVGLVAQEIQANVTDDIQNLVFMSYERDGLPLLALDYSRIAATVLWTQCKAQQKALLELTQRVETLEANLVSK